MKAYIARILVTQKTLICTQGRFSLCSTKAVFAGHLDAMRLSSETPEFKQYSHIMEISGLDWLKGADVKTLSTSLEFIHLLSSLHQKNIIGVEPYRKMLESYYQRFNLHDQRALINKIINPTLDLAHLLPSFIHTGNGAILQKIKMNQVYLLELLSKSRILSIQNFMRIISPQVYNNTDLPLIHRHFFRHVYSQIPQIETAPQLEKLIQYLSRFESIPIHLVRHSIQLLKSKLRKENADVQLDNYLCISNCISLLFFKANNTSQKAKRLWELSQLQLDLSNKPFKFKELTLNLLQLQEKDILASVINELSAQVHKNIASYIKVFNNRKSNNLPPLVESLEHKIIQFLPSLDFEKVIKLVELQLMPTLIKFSLLQIQMKMGSYSSAVKFINSSQFINFCANYPCYPDFYKQLLLTITMFQAHHQKSLIQSDDLSAHVKQFKERVNFYLNHTLKGTDRTEILRHYSPSSAFRGGYQGRRLWSLSGEALVSRLLAMKQDYSFGNMLGMLKEDNQFLRSRMRHNQQEILEQHIAQKLANRQWSTGRWEYPLLYSVEFDPIASIGKRDFKLSNDRFTKDTFFPANVNPEIACKSSKNKIDKATGITKKA